jgi:hypothetical protein
MELALRHLQRTQKKRAVLFLVSDFLGGVDAAMLRSLNRRHDLVALWVRDPLEEHLPPLGLMRLQDLESGTLRWVDSSRPAVRAHWADTFARRRQHLEKAFRAAGVDHLALVAGEDPGPHLEQLFLRRSRRT